MNPCFVQAGWMVQCREAKALNGSLSGMLLTGAAALVSAPGDDVLALVVVLLYKPGDVAVGEMAAAAAAPVAPPDVGARRPNRVRFTTDITSSPSGVLVTGFVRFVVAPAVAGGGG